MPTPPLSRRRRATLRADTSPSPETDPVAALGGLQLSEEEAIRLGDGGLVTRDGFIDPALGREARDVLELWHANGRLTPAGVGRDGHHAGIRGDLTTWVERTDPAPLSTLVVAFEALRVTLASELRLGLQRFSVQAARYDAGAGYKRHRDAFRGDPSRLVTAILYLNPEWEPDHAGRLRAWTPDGVVALAPILGRLVLFRSDAVPHAVLPARKPRFAVTAWFRGSEPIPLLPDPR